MLHEFIADQAAGTQAIYQSREMSIPLPPPPVLIHRVCDYI